MIRTGTRMTAAEFLHLPDNGMRRELIAGAVFEQMPPGAEVPTVA